MPATTPPVRLRRSHGMKVTHGAQFAMIRNVVNLYVLSLILLIAAPVILVLLRPARAATGAPPDESPRAAAASAPSEWWSFQPMRAAALPHVQDKAWPRDSLDHFILAQLEATGLAPAEPADRRTLLRRVTFDLTGLPPTSAEVHDFLADHAPDAWERVVDRLLASPRYGERWGRHWLDVARYADARDLIQLPKESDFREIWRYRDWVVDATNRDLPYDAFLRLQLAGDVLQPADKERIDAEAIVATGFLALADFVPGDVDKQQMIADYVNDQIDVTGRAMLGLTLGCARCHDHKFDPISAEDYYALAGIFFSSRLIPGPVPGNTPLVRVPLVAPAELQRATAEAASAKRRIPEVRRALETADEDAYQRFLGREATANAGAYLLAVWERTRPGTDTEPETGSQPETGAQPMAPQALDGPTLDRWVAYLRRRELIPASVPKPAENRQRTAAGDMLAHVLSAPNRVACEQRVRELEQQLRDVANKLASQAQPGPAADLVFRANDPNVETDSAGRIRRWPDGSNEPQTAVGNQDRPSPVLARALIAGHERPVARFDGQAALQVPRRVPATGSLVVLFRSHPTALAGQRLIGWEDASAGQHGVGLMPDAAGRLHAILRLDGANGDVVVAPDGNREFQLVSLIWGPGGVRVYRQGALVASNPAIAAVSSDPAIRSLTLGGPGSGASPLFQGDLAELRVYASPLDDDARLVIERDVRQRWFELGQSELGQSELANPTPIETLYRDLIATDGPYWLSPEDRPATGSPEVAERTAVLRRELEQLQQLASAEIPQAVAVQEGGPAGTPHEGFRDAHVYLRGNPGELGTVVPRGFPKVLSLGPQPRFGEESGRRQLADWITRADHPLAARVVANRLWQHHFGAGLVRTSTNFGAAGESPSHPELLDHLALGLVASGWSAKALHRAILRSSTYRQSTQSRPETVARDPENRLLGRANRRRLEAEPIRDAFLALADRLDTAQSGPGQSDPASRRRTLYLLTVRTGAKGPDFCPLFDGTDGGTVVERRSESIAAPQALYLLNDRFIAELAGDLARRLLHETPGGTDAQRIDWLYELAFARPPSAEERQIACQFVVESSQVDGSERMQVETWTRFCHIILCTNECIYVD